MCSTICIHVQRVPETHHPMTLTEQEAAEVIGALELFIATHLRDDDGSSTMASNCLGILQAAKDRQPSVTDDPQASYGERMFTESEVRAMAKGINLAVVEIGGYYDANAKWRPVHGVRQGSIEQVFKAHGIVLDSA
jgi:hypothetical protein